MRQPAVAAEPYEQADELLAAARRGAERAAGRALPARAGPRLRRARLAGGRRGAAARPPARCSSSRRTAPTASPGTARAGSRASSSRRTASPRIPRPARPPGRSRSISPGTGGSPTATRSRSARAWRSAGRRRCTRSRARPRRSRSAARPSSSRAASSGSDAPGRRHRQLVRQRQDDALGAARERDSRPATSRSTRFSTARTGRAAGRRSYARRVSAARRRRRGLGLRRHLSHDHRRPGPRPRGHGRRGSTCRVPLVVRQPPAAQLVAEARQGRALEREPRRPLAATDSLALPARVQACLREPASLPGAPRSASAAAGAPAAARTREVEAFVQSIQATESMSGSSNGSERQNTPPLAET